MGSGRFTVVDGLRGIAALMVVLFHAVAAGHVDSLFALLPSWTRHMFLLGENGVAIFFVLSGFVISHSLFDKEMSGAGVVRFTLKRSVRLDPPYWASILLGISFAYLSARIVPGKEFPEYSIAQIVAHLFYLQDLLGFPAIGSVYWTLCFEIQFYLIYALIIFSGKWKQILIVAACFVSSLWPLDLITNTVPGLFPPLWHTFLLGVAAYWAWRRPKAAPMFYLFAAAMLGAGWISESHLTLGATLTSLLLYLCALRGTLLRGLNWRWLQFLGLVSYSLYLTHNVVTGAVFRIGRIIAEPGPGMELTVWLVSIAASVAAAAIFWWALERPSLRLSKWIGSKRASRQGHIPAVSCSSIDHQAPTTGAL